jgi:hypothetical protein
MYPQITWVLFFPFPKKLGHGSDRDDQGPSNNHAHETYAGDPEKTLGGRFWSPGYFGSMTPVYEEIIRRYVHKQELKNRQAEQLVFDY